MDVSVTIAIIYFKFQHVVLDVCMGGTLSQIFIFLSFGIKKTRTFIAFLGHRLLHEDVFANVIKVL